MRGGTPHRVIYLALALLCALSAACSGSPSVPGTGLQDQAAAEATAIIQRAQATALVLQAEAQATAIMQRAQVPAAAPEATATVAIWVPTAAEATPSPSPSDGATEAPTEEPGAVELLSVSFAAEGAFVVVNYMAPPVAAQKFWPGVLSVTDEASGTVFNEVPVMPIIGPLIARPIENGQPGYVMLVHVPSILRMGSQVTVVLADYRFEHVSVQ